MYKDGKSVQRLLGIIFTAIGAIFWAVAITLGIYFWTTSHWFKEVTATVTETGVRTEITYEINENIYFNTLNYISSSHYPGYELPIWVNPDDPNQIAGIERVVVCVGIGGFGLIFLVSDSAFLFLFTGVKKTAQSIAGRH